jgi:uncharacterized membrane protein YfcA
MTAQLLELVLVGLAGGSLGALFGVGGGIILVPGLIFVADLPFTGAVATSLVCVVATSVAGSTVFLRRQVVDLEIAVELQFFTVIGAVAAGLAAAVIPVAPLHFAFAALLLTTAYHMRPRPVTHVARDVPPRRRAAQGASVGAGLVSGLLGVGGGVLNVPILHLLLGRPFERAVAGSIYIIGVTAGAAAAVYLARGDVHVTVAGTTMLGTVVGASLTAAWGVKLDQRFLKLGFALLLVVVAIRMVGRGIAQL